KLVLNHGYRFAQRHAAFEICRNIRYPLAVNPPDVGRTASLSLTDYGRNGQHLAIRSADRDIFKIRGTEPVIRLQTNCNRKFIAPYPKGAGPASAYICLDNL